VFEVILWPNVTDPGGWVTQKAWCCVAAIVFSAFCPELASSATSCQAVTSIRPKSKSSFINISGFLADRRLPLGPKAIFLIPTDYLTYADIMADEVMMLTNWYLRSEKIFRLNLTMAAWQLVYSWQLQPRNIKPFWSPNLQAQHILPCLSICKTCLDIKIALLPGKNAQAQ